MLGIGFPHDGRLPLQPLVNLTSASATNACKARTAAQKWPISQRKACSGGITTQHFPTSVSPASVSPSHLLSFLLTGLRVTAAGTARTLTARTTSRTCATPSLSTASPTRSRDCRPNDSRSPPRYWMDDRPNRRYIDIQRKKGRPGWSPEPGLFCIIM